MLRSTELNMLGKIRITYNDLLKYNQSNCILILESKLKVFKDYAINLRYLS